MLLPSKKSFHWIYVFAIVFIFNISALLISRIVINNSINTQNIIGFTLLSLLIALIASLGYFGSIYLSVIFLIFDVFGIFYMYFIILSNNNDGWSDLVSVAGFLSITGLGIIVGIFLELIYLMIRKNRVK